MEAKKRNTVQSYKVRSNAGFDMGNGAVNSVSKAIQKVSEVIASNIDIQPTIRPVLDLDEIINGANSIDGIFNAQPSVRMLSQLGSINNVMSKRNQNGRNDDVVSAINDLKSGLNGVRGNSYTINGITYDSGSEVSSAIESLIRAVRLNQRA